MHSVIFSENKELAMAVEYIHTALNILRDMHQDRAMRRSVETAHRKFGCSVAAMVANRFLLRGLNFIRDHKMYAEVSRLTEQAIADIAAVTDNEPKRKYKSRVGRMFAIAFLVCSGQNEAAAIGEDFGYCYYLSQTPMKENGFTASFTEAVTGLTRLKLWNPVLKEITSYILAKFEKK